MNQSVIGGDIGGNLINHLCYADDLCLISLLYAGMQPNYVVLMQLNIYQPTMKVNHILCVLSGSKLNFMLLPCT